MTRVFRFNTIRTDHFAGSFTGKSLEKAPVKKESTRIRESFFADFSEKVQALNSKIPIQVSGGFRSRVGMADAIESKKSLVKRPITHQTDKPLRRKHRSHLPWSSCCHRTQRKLCIDASRRKIVAHIFAAPSSRSAERRNTRLRNNRHAS